MITESDIIVPEKVNIKGVNFGSIEKTDSRKYSLFKALYEGMGLFLPEPTGNNTFDTNYVSDVGKSLLSISRKITLPDINIDELRFEIDELIDYIRDPEGVLKAAEAEYLQRKEEKERLKEQERIIRISQEQKVKIVSES